MRVFSILFLLLQVQFTYSQAYITDVLISDNQSGQPIANQSLKSTWAPISASNEQGICRLSFILNPHDKFLPIDYRISEYYPASFKLLYLPVSHNPAYPYMLPLVQQSMREKDYLQLYSKLEAPLLEIHKKNSEEFKARAFFFAVQITTNQLLEMQYQNKFRPVQLAINQVKNGTLSTALQQLDTAKINEYKDELNYEKQQLNIYAPDYAYSLIQIEQKQAQATEALKLRNLLLWLDNKPTSDSGMFILTHTLLSKTAEDAENLYQRQNSVETNPIFQIEQKLALAFMYTDNNMPEKAWQVVSDIKSSYFADEEILQDFPYRMQTDFMLDFLKFQLNATDFDLEKFTQSLQNYNLKQLPDIEWLALISSQNKNSLQNTPKINHTELIKIMVDQRFLYDTVMLHYLNYNFKDATLLLESNWNQILQLNLPNKWKSNYLTSNIILQFITHELAESNANFIKKLEQYKLQLTAAKNPELTAILQFLKDYSQQNFTVLQNQTIALPMVQFLQSLAAKNPNINVLSAEKSILIKNWACIQSSVLNIQAELNYSPNSCEIKEFSQQYPCLNSSKELFLKENPWFSLYFDKINLQFLNCLLNEQNYPSALSLIEENYQKLLADTARPIVQRQKYLYSYQLKQGIIFAKLEQKELALQTLKSIPEAALTGLPQNEAAEWYLNMGNIELSMQNNTEALKFLSKASSLEKNLTNSQIIQLINNKSDIYIAQKNIAQASIELQSGAKKNISETDKILLQIKLGKLQTEQNLLPQAIITLKNAEKNNGFENLEDTEKLKLYLLKSIINQKQLKYSAALQESDSVLQAFETSFSPEALEIKSQINFLSAQIFKAKNQFENSLLALNQCLQNRKQAYEQMPGEYELQLAWPYLEIAELAYSEMQKNKTKEMHQLGEENAGLAVSILKKYTHYANAKNALQRALFLKNYYENIFW